MKAMRKDSVVGNQSLSKWYKNVAHLPWALFLEKEASTVSELTSQFLLIIIQCPAAHILISFSNHPTSVVSKIKKTRLNV